MSLHVLLTLLVLVTVTSSACASSLPHQQQQRSHSKSSTHYHAIHDGIEWSHLNSTQLSALTPSNISTASSYDLSVIPSSACTGWQKQQMQALDTQMLNMAQCTGFTQACMKNIQSDAIQGMISSRCVSQLTPNAVSALTSGQLGALPTGALTTMTPEQISSLSGPVCTGFSAQQLFSLSSQTHPPRIACSGFTSGCLTNLLTGSLVTFPGACLHNVNDSEITGFTVEQLTTLPSRSLIGVVEGQLFSLFAKYGVGLLTPSNNPSTNNTNGGWSASQANEITLMTMQAWMNALDHGTVQSPMIQWDSQTNLTIQSKLALSICATSCMNVLFPSSTSSAANSLPPLSYGGLRALHVSSIPAANLPSLTNPQSWSAWSPSATAALSVEQVQALPSTVFKSLSIGALNSDVMSVLSTDDLSAVPTLTWFSLPCANFVALTSTQLSWLNQTNPSAMVQLKSACAGYVPPPSSSSSSSSTGSPSSSSGPAPDDTDHRDLSVLLTIILTIGCSILAFLLGLATYALCCKRERSGQLQGGAYGSL